MIFQLRRLAFGFQHARSMQLLKFSFESDGQLYSRNDRKGTRKIFFRRRQVRFRCRCQRQDWSIASDSGRSSCSVIDYAHFFVSAFCSNLKQLINAMFCSSVDQEKPLFSSYRRRGAGGVNWGLDRCGITIFSQILKSSSIQESSP